MTVYRNSPEPCAVCGLPCNEHRNDERHAPIPKSVQEKREKNRKRMPNVAELIDQMTKLYGPVKVLAAEDYETGVKVGKFDDE